MIQQVDILAMNGHDLSLPLGDVSSGIILADIQGLDPVKATLVSTEFAMLDGTRHQASRRESRNIVMRMGLDSRYGGESVTAIRRELYHIFMPKNYLEMIFHQSDGPSVEISGYVEIAESPTFTRMPSFGVSILCNDPDFIDQTVNSKGAEAYPNSLEMHDVEYMGTVSSGFDLLMDIEVSGSGNGFTIQQVTPRGDTRSLIFDTPVQARDVIRVKTHPGEKEVTVIRDGVETSVLYAIDPQSEWPMLESGTNKIGAQVTGNTIRSFYEYFWNDRYGGL